MFVQPTSIIEVFKGIKLNRGAEDTLLWQDRNAQNAYFDTTLVQAGNRIFRDTACTFIRNEGKVRVKEAYSVLAPANYLRFINPDFGNKWFYAFVKACRPLAPNDTEIEFEIDDLQTWLPGIDYNLTECRILRQHQTGSDAIGDNTQPEPVSSITTKYWKNSLYDPYYTNDTTPNFYFAVIIDNSGSINLNISPRNSKFISRMYLDAFVLLFDANDATDTANLDTLFKGSGANEGIEQQYIVAIYAIPKKFIKSADIVSGAYDVGKGSTIWFSAKSFANNAEPKADGWVPIVSLSQIPDGTAEGYAPKNAKLFTFPFCWFDILNPDGRHLQVLYEWINNPAPAGPHNPIIDIFGGLLPNDKVTAMPRNYKWTTISSDDVISLPQIPVGIYNNDNYKRALQNVIPTIMTVAGGALGGATLAGGAITGAKLTGSAIMSGLSVSMNEPRREHTGDFNNATTAFANKQLKLEGRQAYPENFKEIDDFFEAYGYTQNKFAVPDITHRTLWTFAQTENANFQSVNVPADAMERINKRYDAGIRFHRNDYTIGNLSAYTNAILT